MTGPATVRKELHAFITEQRLEIERQQNQLDVQFKRTADLQADLDRIKARLAEMVPPVQPTPAPSSNGHKRLVARRSRRQTDTSPGATE